MINQKIISFLKRNPIKSFLGITIIFTCFGLSIFLYYHSKIDPYNLSIEQLSNQGYYVYVLPGELLNQNNWGQRISLKSFDWQCDGDRHDTWNPVNIAYKGNTQDYLDVRISPQDVLWDRTKNHNSVSIYADWIPNQTGEYDTSQKGTTLQVQDKFGMDVVFTSNLPTDKLIILITKMVYNGPNASTIRDPWKDACGTN